jgi:hypothetical protein
MIKRVFVLSAAVTLAAHASNMSASKERLLPTHVLSCMQAQERRAFDETIARQLWKSEWLKNCIAQQEEAYELQHRSFGSIADNPWYFKTYKQLFLDAIKGKVDVQCDMKKDMFGPWNCNVAYFIAFSAAHMKESAEQPTTGWRGWVRSMSRTLRVGSQHHYSVIVHDSSAAKELYHFNPRINPLTDGSCATWFVSAQIKYVRLEEAAALEKDKYHALLVGIRPAIYLCNNDRIVLNKGDQVKEKNLFLPEEIRERMIRYLVPGEYIKPRKEKKRWQYILEEGSDDFLSSRMSIKKPDFSRSVMPVVLLEAYELEKRAGKAGEEKTSLMRFIEKVAPAGLLSKE